MDNKENAKGGFTLEKFTRIYSLCLSVLIGITGVLFIVSACRLYFTGGSTPYSRIRVGEYLKTIIIPIILTVLGIIGAAVLSLIVSIKEKAGKKKPDPILAKRALARAFDASRDSEILLLRKKQRTLFLSSTAAAVFIFAISLVLSVLIPEHAVEGLNGHVVLAVLIMTPAVLIILSGAYAALRLYSHFCEEEVGLMKKKIKAGPVKKKVALPCEFLTRGRLLGIRCAVLALSAIFIALGISNGGMKDVFAKAVAICTECIGLG